MYIHSYDTVKEARESLDNYFRFYNSERPHQSLGYRTPQEVYLNETINKQEEIIHLKSLFFVLTMGSTSPKKVIRSLYLRGNPGFPSKSVSKAYPLSRTKCSSPFSLEEKKEGKYCFPTIKTLGQQGRYAYDVELQKDTF